MVFKSYQFQIIFRLVLIVVNCLGIVYIWQLQMYWVSFYNLVLLLVLQVYMLFRFLTRWQQDIKVFANSVRHGDYNVTYHLLEKNDPHYELYNMLNNVSQYVRLIKSEYVQQNHYFQYVVQNAQVGLIAYEEKGNVILVNQEVLNLLRLTDLKNLSDLKRYDAELFNHISTLGLNQSRLLISGKDRSIKLSARLSKFVIDGKPVFLLSLMNIRPELEENELQSWQELISVLTHEIMNSITPIHSLNGSMAKYLDKIEGNEEIVGKARHSLDVINRRSQSLMTFVDRYRKISTVPLPHLQATDLGKLVEGVVLLMEDELKNVEVKIHHQNEVIQADPALIEQILINLFKNATYSFEGSQAKLVVKIIKEDNKVFVSVKDNGNGIAPEVLERIFIPFFTTREGGSGIGLTLSRQIMHRHGGTIEVKSELQHGTEFILTFPLT